MTDAINPYCPTFLEEPVESWWARLLRAMWFRRRRTPERRSPALERGDAIICGGIAFFIDPEDPTTLYAGSPSLDHSNDRLALIAREAIRYLPEFLSEHRTPMVRLDDRRLVVRIVHSYDGISSDYHRAVEIFPAPLRDRLS